MASPLLDSSNRRCRLSLGSSGSTAFASTVQVLPMSPNGFMTFEPRLRVTHYMKAMTMPRHNTKQVWSPRNLYSLSLPWIVSAFSTTLSPIVGREQTTQLGTFYSVSVSSKPSYNDYPLDDCRLGCTLIICNSSAPNEDFWMT